MKTPICPTCGCSLVRLGISTELSTFHSHHREDYQFCCQGCVDLFITHPEKYLLETSDLIVCPVCLAEKPMRWAAKLRIGEQDVYFCRCPHCQELFKKNSGFYIKRLEGVLPNEGVLDHNGCCLRPD